MSKDKKLKSVTVNNVGIDLDTVLVDLKGEPIKHPDGKEATFRSIALEALLTRMGGEDKSGNLAFRAFRLSQKIADGSIIELTLDERTLIRNHVAALQYITTVIGRMFEILDGKTNNAVLEE